MEAVAIALSCRGCTAHVDLRGDNSVNLSVYVPPWVRPPRGAEQVVQVALGRAVSAYMSLVGVDVYDYQADREGATDLWLDLLRAERRLATDDAENQLWLCVARELGVGDHPLVRERRGCRAS